VDKFILNCKIRWALIKSVFGDNIPYIINLNSNEYISIYYGQIIYYKGKKNHREDGPAVIHTDGSKEWYIEGKRHRIDGPACEWSNGTKSWYVEGKYHRVDGPAVEYADGYKIWYYQGQKIKCKTQQEFEKLIKLKVFW